MYGTTQVLHQGPLIAAIILAAVLWAIRVMVMPEVEVVFSPLGAPLAVGLIYAIIQYALAEVELLGRINMLLAVAAIMFFFIVLNEIRHRWQVTVMVWVVTGLGALLAIHGLVQVLRDGRWVLATSQSESFVGQATGTFPRPADLAVFLQIAFAMAGANFFLSHRSKLEKTGLAFASVLIGGGLLLTGSAWHWLGWGGAVVALAIFIAYKRTWHFRWVVAGVCVLLVVIVTVVIGTISQSNALSQSGTNPTGSSVSGTETGPSLRDKLLAAVNSQSPAKFGTPATASPVLWWEAAWSMGQSNFWVGRGSGMFRWLFPRYRTTQGILEHCPNTYLDVFAESGVVGLGLLIGIIVGCVLALWRIIRVRDAQYSSNRLSNRYAFVVAGLVVFTASVLNAIFDLNLHACGLLFPLLAVMAVGMTCGVHRRVDEEDHGAQPGRHVTIRLVGGSRFILATGLIGLAMLLSLCAYKTYPAEFFMYRANRAWTRMDLASAESLLNRARWFDERNFRITETFGDLYAARATWDLSQRAALSTKAFEWYNRTLTINPYVNDVRIKIARLQDALGNSTEALTAFTAALEVDSQNASYYVMLGQHYLRTGDIDKAQYQFHLAHKLSATEILPEEKTDSAD